MSRDQADVATRYKHLRFAGVMIFTLSAGEGEINELHVGLKGTMNALFLKDLAAKTRRGLRGRVEAGKSGSGICYGYDVVRLHDDAGERIRGEREINEAETVIVYRRDVPVAEIRPLLQASRRRRPVGVDRGTQMPAGFFDPLPDDLLATFEGMAARE